MLAGCKPCSFSGIFAGAFLSGAFGEQFFRAGLTVNVGGTTFSDLSPDGNLAMAASGLSSGGGGCTIQLYSRFSTGRPHLSYSRLCVRKVS